MADGLQIAPATTAQDIAAVVDLCWAYRAFLLNLSSADREITETFYPEDRYGALMDRLAQEHARPRGMILLARARGRAVGCGMSHALDDATCEIKRVFVDGTARRRGIAAGLCGALVAQARGDGFDRVVLDTSATLIAAQRLYAGMGFRQRGPYQPVPASLRDHLRFYELDLRAGS